MALTPPSIALALPARAAQNDGEFYGALLVFSGTATKLYSAIAYGTPYTPSAAVEIVYDEGRGGSSIATYLKNYLPAVVNGAKCVGRSMPVEARTRARRFYHHIFLELIFHIHIFNVIIIHVLM